MTSTSALPPRHGSGPSAGGVGVGVGGLMRRRTPGASRRSAATALAAVLCGASAWLLLDRQVIRPSNAGQRSGRRSSQALAFLPAATAPGPLPAAAAALGDASPFPTNALDLPQLLLAAEDYNYADMGDGAVPITAGVYTDASLGPDLFYYIWSFFYILLIVVVLAIISKPAWDKRFLIDKINKAKLKFITDDASTTALDRFALSRLYIQLRDYPAALGEFEEMEDEWSEARDEFHPEDTMGALASRAMMHNSKGFALTSLEPARPAQARKEFVRAVTFWPEYPQALLNIGRELLKRKRYDVAIKTFDTALKWQPGSETLLEAAKLARAGLEEALLDAQEFDSDGETDDESDDEDEEDNIKK